MIKKEMEDECSRVLSSNLSPHFLLYVMDVRFTYYVINVCGNRKRLVIYCVQWSPYVGLHVQVLCHTYMYMSCVMHEQTMSHRYILYKCYLFWFILNPIRSASLEIH